MAAGLEPKLPLTPDSIDSVKMIKTYKDMVKQNVQYVVRTGPGERTMYPNFGVGLRMYLFEPNTPRTKSRIAARIGQQFAAYLQYLDLQDVTFNEPQELEPNANVLNVRIEYLIVPLGVVDNVAITERI